MARCWAGCRELVLRPGNLGLHAQFGGLVEAIADLFIKHGKPTGGAWTAVVPRIITLDVTRNFCQVADDPELPRQANAGICSR
jgi:hypothetical protein